MQKLTRRHAVVELADGRILTARIINPDTIRYEETARRHGWPGLVVEDGKAEFRGNALRDTFESFAALKRTGQYGGSWEAFRETDCVDLTVNEEEVDPTQPVPASGSVPSSPGSDVAPSPSSETPTTS